MLPFNGEEPVVQMASVEVTFAASSEDWDDMPQAATPRTGRPQGLVEVLAAYLNPVEHVQEFQVALAQLHSAKASQPERSG